MFDPVLTSEAARILGISNETLRAWDRRGLLKAWRTTAGIRVFAREEIERMRLALVERRATRNEADTNI